MSKFLQKQNALLKAYATYSEEALICLTPDLIIAEVNPIVEKIYNSNRDEFIGKSYDECFKSLKAQLPIPQEILSANPNEAITGFENKIFLKNKKDHLIFSWTLVPVIEQNGTIELYLLMGKNITSESLSANARIQDEKSDEENYFDYFINNMPANVYWKNKEGVYLGCNESVVRSFNLKSKKEFIGKTIHELLPKDLADKLLAIDNEVIRTGKAQKIEEVGPSVMGGLGVYLTHKLPLTDKNNNIVGLIGISFDITESKELEKQLEDAKSKAERRAISAVANFENIISCMPGIVYWKDKQGIYKGCNELAATNAGFSSSEEMIGKTDDDLAARLGWDKETAQNFKAIDQKVIESGRPMVNVEEAPYNDINGNIIYPLSNKVPLRDEDDNVIGLVGISIDIGDRKKIEEDLREAKERAEAANRSKSEFLAAVSHELRIPLTGILGMARLLVDDEMPDSQRKQIKDIVMSGEHLLALVNDLLDIAKFEAGKLELNPGALDFRRLIEEISTMLIFQASTKNLELITEYADDAPHMLIGDSRALRQVLLNLMGNAVKFTERGHVKIRVYSTEREQLRAKLVIIVEDTGIGIPADKKDSVFERFNQVDSSRTRRYGGAGLGLTITKAYVELMGGKISVESEFGKGTQFICKIPFALQDMVHRPSAWEQYKSWVRVLIIDDTQRGDVLSKHLDSPLVKVARGADGFNTLMSAQHQKQHFHIVIIDQQLQSTDAMELGRKIKSQRGIIQPMMVLLMPPSTLPAKESAKVSGFYEILTKPVHPTELYVTLTAAWEKWEDSHRSKNKAIPAFAQHQPQVLLVEDDPIIQKVHSMMLERVGCKIGVASNGDEALKMFNQGYDAILMDVGLPGMSGIEIATEIRKREAGNGRIPIIGVTGYGYEEDKRNCLEAGMDDVAVKPLKPDELTQILVKWVAGAKPIN